MNPLKDWPLRTQIRLLALVPAAIVTLILTVYFVQERFSAFEKELLARGQTMANQLAPASEYGLFSGNQESLASLADALVREADVQHVLVRDEEGRVLLGRRRHAALSNQDERVRVFTAPVHLQQIGVDTLAAVDGGPGGGSGRVIGHVEIALGTDAVIGEQRGVLLKALLLAVMVLVATAFLASRIADAVARIEEARVSAENASREKGDFLAMMSHELRTPMNGVMGMLELLQDTPMNEDQREFLQTARRSGEHLMEVINDVLDFSRIEGGRLPVESIEFDLPAFLLETVESFRNEADRRALALRLDVDPVLRGLSVTSDPTRLRQVLVNLLGNALKFTDHGRVSVHASGFVEAGQVALLIEVEDSGIGIPKEQIGAMFEPFRQADSSISRRYGGTGLGLPIARRLALMLGGDLTVRSAIGEGSCFTIRMQLPARRRPLRPEPPASPDSLSCVVPSLQGRRVLVVEDNPVSRRVAEGMLEALGVETECAADGNEALARVAEQRYDAVLMDLQMPGMDGLEVLRRLRRLPAGEGGGIPVIALTANALIAERERCLAAGMKGFIAKPYTRQQLKDVLVSVLPANQSSG